MSHNIIIRTGDAGQVPGELVHALVEVEQVAKGNECVRNGRCDEAQVVTQARAVVVVQRTLLRQAVRVCQAQDPCHNVRQLLDHKVVKDSVCPVNLGLPQLNIVEWVMETNRIVLVLLQLVELERNDLAFAGVAAKERNRLAVQAQAGVHIAAVLL